MSTIKTALCLLTIFCAYAVVGSMDYEDAVMMENAYRQPASTVCLSAISDSSSPSLDNAQVNPAVVDASIELDGCDVQRR